MSRGPADVWSSTASITSAKLSQVIICPSRLISILVVWLAGLTESQILPSKFALSAAPSITHSETICSKRGPPGERIGKIDDPDLGVTLVDTVDPLLDLHQVPRQIIIDQEAAELEIQPGGLVLPW
jgi:hypothetical protein